MRSASSLVHKKAEQVVEKRSVLSSFHQYLQTRFCSCRKKPLCVQTRRVDFENLPRRHEEENEDDPFHISVEAAADAVMKLTAEK